MRIAYFTTDEVNQDLAVRMAECCGATVYLLSPQDTPPDGCFDAVLYDWDYWPVASRREVLQQLLAAPAPGLVAIHGYHLDEEHAAALQRNGVVMFRRLEPRIFLFLRRATRQGLAG